MDIIIALILSLSAIFASPAPEVASPAPATEVAQQVAQVDTSAQVLEMDAWVTWEEAIPETPITSDTISYSHVGYSETKPTNLPLDQMTLQSVDFGGWHVYKALWLTQA